MFTVNTFFFLLITPPSLLEKNMLHHMETGCWFSFKELYEDVDLLHLCLTSFTLSVLVDLSMGYFWVFFFFYLNVKLRAMFNKGSYMYLCARRSGMENVPAGKQEERVFFRLSEKQSWIISYPGKCLFLFFFLSGKDGLLCPFLLLSLSWIPTN